MKPMTLQQAAQATRGKLIAAPEAGVAPLVAVCTDTRQIVAGSVFVALKGDNFDGHAFLEKAHAGGSIAAVVQTLPEPPVPGMHLILVDDTRKSLGRLAQLVRRQMKNTTFVAVAGSNGKTSTKHLVHAALSGKLRGTLSPKSYNNDIGVPLTLFPVNATDDYCILEVGTNHHGEIRWLTEIAEPDIAVITNCGAEHLEGLTDLAGVRAENASIIAGLQQDGLLVINGDDPELVKACSHYAGMTLKFGFEKTNDLFATDVVCTDEGVRFKLNGRKSEVFVPMLGRHTASNALAAIAVARRLGVAEEAVIESLGAARGPDMRLQLQNVGGVRVINDAYNANPNSMRAAIETLASLPATGRRVAVVGDMKELGDQSDHYHREIGEFAASKMPDVLVCIGAGGKLIAEAAVTAGLDASRVQHFPDATSAAEPVAAMLLQGDLVLLKASRSMKLETVANQIHRLQNDPPARLAG